MIDPSESSRKLREILQPLPLKASGNWVLRAVKRAIKEGRLPRRDLMTTVDDAVGHATRSGNKDWFAKSGVLTLHGKKLLVCEPYSEKVSLAMLEGLESFVDALDYNYVFSSNSYYFPGRTVRIVIGPAALVESYRLQEFATANERK
jgi:hypothetical protein